MEIVSNSNSEYSDILIAVNAIKNAIIESRYQLAKIVNKEAITDRKSTRLNSSHTS